MFHRSLLFSVLQLLTICSPTLSFLQRSPRKSLSLATGSLFLFQSFGQKIGQKMSSKAAMAATTVSSSIQSDAKSALSIQERKKAALFGLYVADSVAMPVHWMYNLAQLQRDYGTIRGYVKPKDRFEGSIMNLSNTGGGGRGSDAGDIIGKVINHGKKQYWGRGGNYHYHLGLDAGDNTLEAQLSRLLTRSITNAKEFSKSSFLSEYITFMTTPGSHADTYASTCHRMFFANHVRGLAPEKCADNDGHNTDAIDALTLTIPVIIHYADAPRALRNEKIAEIISATRKSRVLQSYAENYADILVEVLHGKDLQTTIETYGSKLETDDDDGLIRSIRSMVKNSRSDPMVACYIDSAYPALLFFAYKYADSPEAAILASANAGGENVARGSLLGALMGASHGLAGFPAWTYQLKEKDAVFQEIDGLLAVSPEATAPVSAADL